MDYPLINQEGAQKGTVSLRDDVFGMTPNGAVVHQTLVAQLANARQGTHDTKTRGEVAGSTKKLYRQKGTGRARQGASRAPHRKGGGVVFGPHPRDHSQALPKKMRRLAIRSVISAKAADGELVLVESLAFPEPKTKAMVETLRNLGIDATALVVTEKPDRNLVLSARNVPGVFTLPAAQLNVATMLAHRYLVLTQEAARRVEQLWGQGETSTGEVV